MLWRKNLGMLDKAGECNFLVVSLDFQSFSQEKHAKNKNKRSNFVLHYDNFSLLFEFSAFGLRFIRKTKIKFSN